MTKESYIIEFEKEEDLPIFASKTEKYPTYRYIEERKYYYDSLCVKLDSTLSQKACYRLHGRIWGHYWRARKAIENASTKKDYIDKLKKIMKCERYKYTSGYRLDIDHYTKHWLYANQGRENPEVIAAIKDTFGYEPLKNKYLAKGYSMYIFND